MGQPVFIGEAKVQSRNEAKKKYEQEGFGEEGKVEGEELFQRIVLLPVLQQPYYENNHVHLLVPLNSLESLF